MTRCNYTVYNYTVYSLCVAMMIAKKTDPAVTIRFPKKVLDGVTRAASTNKRSRNTEVVSRLAESLGIVGALGAKPLK